MSITQIVRRIGILSVWAAVPLFVFAGVNKNDPYLTPLRGPGNICLIAANILLLFVLMRRGYWRTRGIAGKLLVALWCLPALAMLGAHLSLQVRKREVLNTEVTQAHRLGAHFVVGYSSFPEVACWPRRA